MRVLGAVLLIVVLLAAIAFVWFEPGSAVITSPGPVVANQTPAGAGPGGVAETRAEHPVERYVSPREQELWAAERPAAEANLPDPDGVGPCPPRRITGMKDESTVTWRGLEQGIPTWKLANGVRVQIVPSQQQDKDGNLVDGFSYLVGDPRIEPARIDMRLEQSSVPPGTGGSAKEPGK
jgi:hypothetical protein